MQWPFPQPPRSNQQDGERHGQKARPNGSVGGLSHILSRLGRLSGPPESETPARP